MIAPPASIVVCDRCAVRRLDDALRIARDGASIVVEGTQRGNFVVRRRLTISGAGSAVLDGQGRGTVLTIDVPGVVVRHLAIRGSGADFVAMDAGLRANAPRTTVDDLTITDSLFGVYFARADDSLISHVYVFGRRAVAIPDRGDGLRVWYSSNVRIQDNVVQDARDDLIWFSGGVSILRNHISGGRYGIHTMYSNGMTVASNVVRNCEVGSYAMYGKNLRVENNLFVDNRGSTGYGIGMKAIDDAVVRNNAFVSNHAGIYLDNSPSFIDAKDLFENNLLAYNEIGIASLPSSRNDVVIGNTFLQNYRQVSALGGGTLTHMTWTRGNRGNYWSDYAGYDRNGTGIGDVPYEEDSAYGTLADLDDRLDLLTYSPAARAIDFAANALPMFAPPATIVDGAPMMQPTYPQGVQVIAPRKSRASYASIGAVALAFSLGILIPLRPLVQRRRRAESGAGVIQTRDLRKRFGRIVALDGIDLKIPAGETLALWGPNGSGKTTLIRCLLGIVNYDGEVVIRGSVGYVPQQLPAFDMRVGEFAEFIASLHGVGVKEADGALSAGELLDLRERNVHELSGGQRQRLAVAVAGLGDADILLLDEPTVGLDLASRQTIMRALKRAKAHGKTIVISSHVPEDVIAIADRIVVMSEGKIQAVVTPAEFAQIVERGREAVS